ncbi:HAMP domain-containing sensor histidine kinase [Ammonicoccus fulvus]|uniref:histidine kinase n=1 Tax=Ammonicoccus fulvus TaxID=3138240 RepID=A0ABZ3FTD1_9ACTN
MRIPARGSLARRTLTGHLLVAGITVLAAALVSALVGPTIFHDHLVQAGLSGTPDEVLHIEQAYRDANLWSLLAGLAVATVCALAVTWWQTIRVRRALEEVGQAAHMIADGRSGARVPRTGDGIELDDLADSFNTMAERLDHIEETRRRLLADVGHELRTPVATLTAYLEGLTDGVAEWNNQTRDLMHKQVERLSVLVRDLSAVSRAEEGMLGLELRATRASEVLARAAAAAEPAYREKDVEVTLADGRDPLVMVDTNRISQVLANLLGNALRHTPSGGAVTMSVATTGREVTLEVGDTGEGIGPDHLPHIFERFYRADTGRSRDRAGSGIGLTISRAIVEAHGGRLTADSAGPGRGATFRITLPADRDAVD